MVKRIGSGVTGEVFQIKHKKTGVVMAAKVSKRDMGSGDFLDLLRLLLTQSGSQHFIIVYLLYVLLPAEILISDIVLQ